MTIPTSLELTPNATATQGVGASTAVASEFWQMTSGGFIVYGPIPYNTMVNLQQIVGGGGQIDSSIALQLSAYPKRVVSKTASSPS